MDFAKLREEGIGHIERMAGDGWTDYNTHDPGITLLEVLCYALTDLGYRMALPIEDLLATPTGNEANMRRQFQTAAQALACGPVTENDYRKLFMDISFTDGNGQEKPAVLNAWLTKHEGANYFIHCKTSKLSHTPPRDRNERFIPLTINGLYDLQLQLNPAIYEGLNTVPLRRRQENDLFKKARQVFQANRNLCEDLVGVTTVNYQQFSICADIQLVPAADIEEVHALILWKVQRFLTPPVNRYGLDELLEKGVPVEQIFDGPVPRFGFFEENELEKSAIPDTGRTIRTSDLIGLIMRVPGVVSIPKFHLKFTDDPSEKGALWSVDIAADRLPQLSRTSPIRLFKDVFRYIPKADEVDARLLAFEQADLAKRQVLATAAHDLPLPLGTWRNAGQFGTVANDLPRLYGLGPMGLPPVGGPEAEARRLAQARQLRAYLMFFDQILSNHAALLEALPTLLGPSPDGVSELRVRQTYFAKLTDGVRDVRAIFKHLSAAADDADFETRLAQMPERLTGLSFSKKVDNLLLHQRRRTRQLDHLLARYAERFDDYVLMMTRVFGGKRQAWEVIDDKDDFLNEYPLLSQQRARGYNATAIGLDEIGQPVPLKLWYDASDANLPAALTNVAGVVRRVANLTGIDNYKTRNLSKIDYQVYQEKDDDDKSEFRWRVVDVDGKKILLSGSTKYGTEEACILEMKKAVQRGQFPDGFDRKTAVDGRRYFNLIDETGEVIGRRIEYFTSEEAMEDAIQYVIDFLTERFSEEGLFVVEHLLLRPTGRQDQFLPVCTDEGCHVCESVDPYSFRVSVVLPGYAPRFTNMAFRSFFERTLRAELPAHVLAKICWIGRDQMAIFEERYRAWLEYRQQMLDSGKPDRSNKTLDELLDIMEDLYTIYPPGTLHDCEEDEEDRPIVLGRSRLGSQREVDLNPEE